MSLINITDLTFAYEGSFDTVFESVSFQMDTDWKLGFTGRNGSGKTTFLNLLLGKYEYSGKISASVRFDYFPYPVADKSAITQDVINEICLSYQEWELMRELSLLDVSDNVLYRPFDTLSNGEQTKVLLAALFLNENNFLLIDEPTNHLDMAGRAIVGEYLASKKGFILVSHDRAFLDGCVDHILSINRVNIEVQRGNFSSWLANKERQDEFELAENAKLKKEIKRLEKTAREKSVWANKIEDTKKGSKVRGGSSGGLGTTDRGYIGAQSARMMKKSKTIEQRSQKAVEDKSKLLKNLDRVDDLKLAMMPYHTSRYVSLRDVSIFYGDKVACQTVSFSIERGDRAVLIGRNGSGKSSIAKLICGESLTYTGDFTKGSGLKISYVSQDTSFLKGNLTEFAIDNEIDESLFKAVLHKLDFSRNQFEKNMEDFSGGQKKKVLIAKSLCEKAHLLIWDEPLNFVDVLSRMQIEELLLRHAPTILFIEHDRLFCDTIATKAIQL